MVSSLGAERHVSVFLHDGEEWDPIIVWRVNLGGDIRYVEGLRTDDFWSVVASAIGAYSDEEE